MTQAVEAPVRVRGFALPKSIKAAQEKMAKTAALREQQQAKAAAERVKAKPGRWPKLADGTYKKPETPEEFELFLSDPVARLCSGFLYQIMLKSPDGDESVVPFIPNHAQRRLIQRLWYRNIILKARQLGFTTLIAIMWLDHALFNADQRCGIIAQDKEAAEIIFRDKVKLAYERLPDVLREKMPLKRDSASELLFAHNNSSIRVATSMRSGTIHRLHISEYGKICAKYPDKAVEVQKGSLPAVPLDGIVIIESTAEGQEGDFYEKTQRAIKLAQSQATLTERDYRIHFYAWWMDPAYRLASTSAPMTPADNDYFHKIEAETGTKLSVEQRNWYCATRDSDFSEDPEGMWQEYPSSAREAFQVSTEGVYYAKQLADARKAGRITKVPYTPGIKVNTFWDIGNSDGTAIWLHQRVGFENRFIGFIEGWGEPYGHYTAELQKFGYTWGTHYLPHDADVKRQGQHANKSPKEMLEALNIGGEFDIVPVVDELIHGIQATRDAFSTAWFDAEACGPGIKHLDNYKKVWDRAKGAWKINEARKIDGHSEAADALRQWGQGYIAPKMKEKRERTRRGGWRTT